MSTPTSAIAATAEGFTRSPGTEPAERTSTRSPARWVRNPAAICERPALWTQTNRTEAAGAAVIGTGAFCSGATDGGRMSAPRPVTYQPMVTSVDNEVMRTLADPLRMRILRLLAVESLCVCHLVE